MKQLSLLLLAGLTTGCFAAESAQANPTCWEFVKMLHDPQYRAAIDHKYAGVDVLTRPGYADCAEKFDQLVRVSDRRDLDPVDQEILLAIRGRLARRMGIPRCKSPAYLSLEEAVAQDDDMQMTIAAVNNHVNKAKEILAEAAKSYNELPSAEIIDLIKSRAS